MSSRDFRGASAFEVFFVMADFFQLVWSYFAIFLVMMLTGAGLPIPEEVPIIAAGIASAHGSLIPWLAFTCCLAGALIGDCIMYYLGYHFGRGILKDHPWFARFLTPEREAQIEDKFRKHGLGVFFIARFLVGLRSPVYITAGILRVSFRRFLMIDLVCATIVVGTFFGLTYFYGKEITAWVKRAEVGLSVAVVLLALSVGIYLWRRHLKKKSERLVENEKSAESKNA
jgi:membrane protein DedA with SNARE-associated domain